MIINNVKRDKICLNCFFFIFPRVCLYFWEMDLNMVKCVKIFYNNSMEYFCNSEEC